MRDEEGRREDEAGQWGGAVEMDSAGLQDPGLGPKGRIEGLLP